MVNLPVSIVDMNTVALGTRDRMAAAAADLFYAEGITASGVDAIARHAAVAKPTLYSHFRSKADLVVAALAAQHRGREQMMERWLVERSAAPPALRLLAVFDWLEAWSAEAGGRGCPFLNAAAELVGPQYQAAREVVRQHKAWWLALLAGLARDAGARNPDTLAQELLLLMDGANARVLVTGDPSMVAVARGIATRLVCESLGLAPAVPGDDPARATDA